MGACTHWSIEPAAAWAALPSVDWHHRPVDPPGSFRTKKRDCLGDLDIGPQASFGKLILQEPGITFWIVALIVGPAARREVYRTRTDSINADVIGGEVPGKRRCQEYLSGLGRTVLGPRTGLSGGYGRHDHDAGVVTALHVGHRSSYGAHRVHQIHVQRSHLVFVSGFEGFSTTEPADVAYQSVNAAKLLDRAVYE